METKFISKDKIKQFIDNLEGDVFIPQEKEDFFSWQKYPCNFSLRGFRTILPPKFFFYSPQEVLKEKEIVKRTVVGIKACDLKGVLFLKKVFKEGDFVDPFFRDDILIISSDCTELHKNCFCSLLGDNPYPEKGFDLNLSEVKDGFIVEIGSDRGKKLVEENEGLFSSVEPEGLEERKQRRDALRKEIKGEKIDFDGKEVKSEKITDEIKKCVSCTACTIVCPSCFCFLLDEKSDFEKIRFWDSCQYPGYARVAGGANPRKELDKRFIHRVKCKFEYSPERFGSRGCFGCGRCISGCLGGINFKDVLLRLVEK
ncbi:4Fe-4S dicluster domain-containing protein [candidate division WOR-3 bacterium]|nr:4Fe-4S dicluster domain-containing protein [candidate division WOR-3 bacterium]